MGTSCDLEALLDSTSRLRWFHSSIPAPTPLNERQWRSLARDATSAAAVLACRYTAPTVGLYAVVSAMASSDTTCGVLSVVKKTPNARPAVEARAPRSWRGGASRDRRQNASVSATTIATTALPERASRSRPRSSFGLPHPPIPLRCRREAATSALACKLAEQRHPLLQAPGHRQTRHLRVVADEPRVQC